MTSTAAPPAFDYEAKHWGAAPLRPKPWYMNGLKLRYLLEDLRDIRGRVLDVGCGAGQVAKAVKMARPDLTVVGCDMSHSAVAAASARPRDVDFRLATAERLPFSEGVCDVGGPGMTSCTRGWRFRTSATARIARSNRFCG